MCGRFALTLPHEAMAQLFDASIGQTLMPMPRYNICPSQHITVAVSAEDGRHLVPMRWGFVPKWYKAFNDGPMLINARGETVAEKPAFRSAVRERRCLIPATGYYEWTKDEDGNRLPWYFHPKAQDAVAFAGIWQDWTDDQGKTTQTCAMVTIGANETISPVHHRMPVTITPDNFGLWLGEQGLGAAPLMQAGPEDLFVYHRVDPAVNSNRPDGPELILPFDD